VGLDRQPPSHAPTEEESMQLNKNHKAEIINKIMEDIPRVNYAQIISDTVQAKARDLMPEEVRVVYDNVATRKFLSKRHCVAYGDYTGGIGYVYWGAKTTHDTLYLNRLHYHDGDDDLTKKLLAEVRVAVGDAVRCAEDQGKARNSMREKLYTMLVGIRTLKQAKALLEPELHKYLPVEPPKDEAQKAAQASTALVPYVVANLREMGWPKEDQQSTEGSN
jgi:hypothetical protein